MLATFKLFFDILMPVHIGYCQAFKRAVTDDMKERSSRIVLDTSGTGPGVVVRDDIKMLSLSGFIKIQYSSDVSKLAGQENLFNI
jgi:hypothetical protein